jgi:hypothetical protein
VEFASCQISGASNFEVAPRFVENVCASALNIASTRCNDHELFESLLYETNPEN